MELTVTVPWPLSRGSMFLSPGGRSRIGHSCSAAPVSPRRIPGGGLSYPVSGFFSVSQAAMASNGSNSKGRRVMVAPVAKCSPF